MQFLDAGLNAVLDSWAADADPQERACAHNVLFDERISAPRRSIFEVYQDSATEPRTMRRRAVDYYEERVRTDRMLPDTFSASNAAANLGDLSPEQKMLRLECLFEPLDKTGVSFTALGQALGRHDRGSHTLVDDFLEQWNTRPDIRRNPVSFAAFQEECLDELAAPDWPDRLRDRLGLPHYNPTPAPIPVALMLYEAGEITNQVARDAVAAQTFCAPTALDGSPYTQFMPTPYELNFGCPMGLDPIISDENLIAEVVHPRLRYQRRHLVRVGYVNTLIPPVNLINLRNAHIMALRLASGRYDFGMDL